MKISKKYKIKVLYCLVSFDKGYEDLTDRDLKVLCNIFNLPWYIIVNLQPLLIFKLRFL